MMHFVLWALVNTVCCVLTDGIMLCVPGCFVACYACGYRRTLRESYNLEVYRFSIPSHFNCCKAISLRITSLFYNDSVAHLSCTIELLTL